MSLPLGIATYFILWWVVLFAILPLNVRPQHETGKTVPGTAESAPVTPALLRKFLLTTLVTSILFLIIDLNFIYGWITLDSIPFFPRFERQF